MGTNAVAIVHIAPDAVRAALEPAPDQERARFGDHPGEVLTGGDGNPYRIRFFDDAVAVYLGVGLGYGDPDVMGVLVATALGDLIDTHDDPRGVPLIPESYDPKSRTWDALVEELGEAADWVPIEGAEVMDPMQGLLGAFGAQAGDLMGLAAQMQGQDPAALMRQAMQMAQQLAASGGLEQMQRAMQQMMPQMMPPMTPSDPQGVIDAQLEDAEGGAGAPPAPPALDLEAMARQAEQMLDANPELKRQLLAQFGGGLEGGPGDEGGPKKK